MKKMMYTLLLAMMGCGQANSAAPGPLNAQQYIARQGWTVYEGARQISSPAPSVVPVVYEAKGARAPSCALLTGNDAAPIFIDVWGPEKGSDWPQCLGFNDAAAFKLDNRDYLVFEFLNQDTREDTYRRHFYLVKDAAGQFVEAKELNASKNRPKSNRASSDNMAPGAKEGIALARSINVSNSLVDVQLSHRDFLLDGSRSFGLYQDKAKTKCTFVVENGVTPLITRHDAFPDAQTDNCAEILASGKLEKSGKTYYLAMYKGIRQNHVAVFSVTKDNVVAVENGLSEMLGKREKLADMKSAKKALSAAIG